MFQRGFLSIIRSLALYTAIGTCHSGWWTENLSKTCRVLFQK